MCRSTTKLKTEKYCFLSVFFEIFATKIIIFIIKKKSLSNINA